MRYAQSLGKKEWVIDYRNGVYYIGTPEKLFKTDSEQDMVKLIFGPLKAHEIHNFNNETAKLIEQVLPIPFWVWGWDSI